MKFFTADCHFGHEKLAKVRGFANSNEHDEYLLDQINTMVKKNDQLFILGDFSMPKPQKFRMRILCRHITFIKGNHDRHQASVETFGQFSQIYSTKICGHHTILCHYPINYWPSSHHGSFHLYGHTHSMREETLDKAFPGRRSIDVGVDNAKRFIWGYMPFDEDWLYEYLIKRPGHDHVADYDAMRGGVT